MDNFVVVDIAFVNCSQIRNTAFVNCSQVSLKCTALFDCWECLCDAADEFIWWSPQVHREVHAGRQPG